MPEAVLPFRPLLVTGDHTDEMAATRTLLADVAAGRHPPALRLYRPQPTVAFSRRETHRPGYPAAVAAAHRHGFQPVVRNAGGQAVAYAPGSLVVELVGPDPSPVDRLRARFAAFAGTLAATLRTLGVDASVGRLDGEYCPGDYSILGAGRIKLAGTAQRLVSRAWLCSASLIVEDAAPLRAVLIDVYHCLQVSWRPETLAAAADLTPAITVPDVETAIGAAAW
jgi:octanoyl-[GcvH]:protein N-octanoyltransferase